MIFDLTINRDGETEPVMLAQYMGVEITWQAYGEHGCTAIAKRDGAVIAELKTFDDYPIEILETHIQINGVVGKGGNPKETEYGNWQLSHKP